MVLMTLGWLGFQHFDLDSNLSGLPKKRFGIVVAMVSGETSLSPIKFPSIHMRM